MQNENQTLTVDQYLDALPADMRGAVLGLISSKFLFDAACRGRPEKRMEFELLSFTIAKAIAGPGNSDYLDAMINHAMIINQIREKEENAAH